MSNGIVYKLKKKQVVINVKENVEEKTFLVNLRKKIVELKKVYNEIQPIFIISGKKFTEKCIGNIEKIIKKYFDTEIKYDVNSVLGLCGIRTPFKKEIGTSKTKFVRNPLRSGQKVEYEGSIIVLGDVNCGAEVIAGENIVIFGTLRGLAHAGAAGNKEAIITANSIEAMQIRISNIVKECEKQEFNGGIIKTNAYLSDEDKIIIE